MEIKRTFNETLGLIPFAELAQVYSATITALSYVISNNVNFSTFFIVSCVCLMMFYMVSMVYYVVYSGSSTNITLTNARNAICDTLSEIGTNSEARNALYRLVTSVELVKASAYGMFDIECDLALKFPNAVIPFTIMIVTIPSGLIK